MTHNLGVFHSRPAGAGTLHEQCNPKALKSNREIFLERLRFAYPLDLTGEDPFEDMVHVLKVPLQGKGRAKLFKCQIGKYFRVIFDG